MNINLTIDKDDDDLSFSKYQFILAWKIVPCQDMNDLRIIPLAVTLTANCILLANIEGHT